MRFAPSPTGFLHIGGVRSALYNWLYARKNQGQFLLRIEDTDTERSEEKYTTDIFASIKWLGLHWDEEPLYQSKRLDIYAAKVKELVAQGHAYYCTCTESDVEKMREIAMATGKKPMYDRRCRGKKEEPKGIPYVVRTAVPLDGYVEWDDLIRGSIRIENTEVDDFVLIRSNGAPTYNLSVVVDDGESKMTHVIRGEEHTTNTPKQIHLYRFLNYPVPRFGHLPVILAADKKKLSKRHGAVSVNWYRSEGFLPEALLNFLARLGWSHGDQEIFTIDELIQYFDWDHVQKAGAVFNHEKLLWLNGEHIRKADPKRIAEILVTDFRDHFKAPSEAGRVTSDLGVKIVSLILPKVKLLKEAVEQIVPLCTPGAVEVDTSGLKWNKDPNLKAATQAAVAKIVSDLSSKIAAASASGKKTTRVGNDAIWGSSLSLGDLGMTHVEIDAFLRQICEQTGVKLGDLTQPMRLTVTGRMVSVGLFDLLPLLPWDMVEARLKKIASL